MEEAEVPVPPVLHAAQTPPLRAGDGVQHRLGGRRSGDGGEQQRGLQWEQRQLSGEGELREPSRPSLPTCSQYFLRQKGFSKSSVV